MAQIPFHVEYSLSRSQRLVPHLRVWGPLWPLFIILFLFVFVQTVVSLCTLSGFGAAVYGSLTLLVLVLCRGLFVGLIDVLLVPVHHMDVTVEDNAMSVLLGGERWHLFLDTIIDLQNFRKDTWTVQFYNGCVVNISASAIQEDQLDHLRAAMERGRTPEGIQAKIERGRRINMIMESKHGAGS